MISSKTLPSKLLLPSTREKHQLFVQQKVTGGLFMEVEQDVACQAPPHHHNDKDGIDEGATSFGWLQRLGMV
jgi:hypothetical protein